MLDFNSQYLKNSNIEIFQEKDPLELYGRWNALIAFDKENRLLGYENAHDGDFFPETFNDYVGRIKQSLTNRKSGFKDISFPVRVDIDITQKCNSNCSFCFSKKYQNRKYANQWINKNDIELLLINFSKLGVKSIRYCGGGEPLLHPDIKEILKLPKKYNLLLSLITNGDYLDNELTELITRYVDKLHWSVNAATDHLRNKIHRPLAPVISLSQTVEYIKDICTSRISKKTPLVWASYLIIPENIQEIIKATKKLKNIGVDSLSFRPVYHRLHTNWSSSQLNHLNNILNKIKKYEDSSFFVFTPKRNILEANKLIPYLFFKRCISRSLRTIIEPSLEGLYLQNCGIYRGTADVSGLKINDSNDFSEKWHFFQSELNPINAPFDCNNCIDISMNTTLNFIEKILLKDNEASFYCAKIKDNRQKAGHNIGYSKYVLDT